MASLVLEKICAALSIVVLSMAFGLLPLLLARKYQLTTSDTQNPILSKKEKKKLNNVILSFLLNLGGGVLLANCFCHWLPEVREGLDHGNIDSVLPLAEVIMCSGFFLISVLEEIIHHFLAPHHDKKSKKNNSQVHPQSAEKGPVDCWNDEQEEQKTIDNLKAALRTTFVLLALSFHSVVEGLALSLEQEGSGVWLNTGATALHKFVIAFSLGVELLSNKASKLQYYLSITIFSIAPAIGCASGILVEHLTGSNSVSDLPLQILQGLATGTIIYVIFQEILPKAKEVGGTGFQHVTAMLLGFGIFLPSLLLHGTHGHGDEAPCGPGHGDEDLLANISQHLMDSSHSHTH